MERPGLADLIRTHLREGRFSLVPRKVGRFGEDLSSTRFRILRGNIVIADLEIQNPTEALFSTLSISRSALRKTLDFHHPDSFRWLDRLVSRAWERRKQDAPLKILDVDRWRKQRRDRKARKKAKRKNR